MANQTLLKAALVLRIVLRFVFSFALLIAIHTAQAAAQDQTIPNFWDRHERFIKPDLAGIVRLRFLTTTDFPPFNFIDRSKRLTGFHVDLARAICAELDLLQRCQIQALPWEDLGSALEKGEGEVILAGLAISAETREKYDFSRPYLHIPARFIANSNSGLAEPMYAATKDVPIGIVEGSAHERYLTDLFRNRELRKYPTKREALVALRGGELQAFFSDAVSLSFWLASEESQNCCRFVGGPYISEAHFGNGMAVAVNKGETVIRDAIDFALSRINENGKFAELYLRYFPAGLF